MAATWPWGAILGCRSAVAQVSRPLALLCSFMGLTELGPTKTTPAGRECKRTLRCSRADVKPDELGAMVCPVHAVIRVVEVLAAAGRTDKLPVPEEVAKVPLSVGARLAPMAKVPAVAAVYEYVAIYPETPNR